MERRVGVERLDGGHGVSFGLGGQDHLAAGQPPIEKHCRGAGLTGGRTEPDTDHSFPAKDPEQALVDLALQGAADAVELEGDLHQVPPPEAVTTRAASTPARCSL